MAAFVSEGSSVILPVFILEGNLGCSGACKGLHELSELVAIGSQLGWVAAYNGALTRLDRAMIAKKWPIFFLLFKDIRVILVRIFNVNLQRNPYYRTLRRLSR